MLARTFDLVRRLFAFVWRHRWSVPLTVLSAACFVELGSELRDDDLGAFDAWASTTVQGLRGSVDGPMLAFTRAGAGLPMAAVAIAGVSVLLLLKRRWDAAFLAVSAAGVGLLNTLLKLLFRRARPEGELLYLVDPPSSFSFPSGHAMGSAGVILSLLILVSVRRLPALVRWIALCAGAAFVVGVAASRVYFGVHFPSDVVGGLLAGAAWVSAVTGWFYPRLLPGEEAVESAR